MRHNIVNNNCTSDSNLSQDILNSTLIQAKTKCEDMDVDETYDISNDSDSIINESDDIIYLSDTCDDGYNVSAATTTRTTTTTST